MELTTEQSERLHQARANWIHHAIGELNALANLIEAIDPDKAALCLTEVKRCAELAAGSFAAFTDTLRFILGLGENAELPYQTIIVSDQAGQS